MPAEAKPQPPPGATALVSAWIRIRQHSTSAAVCVRFGRRNFAFHGVVRTGGAGEIQNLHEASSTWDIDFEQPDSRGSGSKGMTRQAFDARSTTTRLGSEEASAAAPDAEASASVAGFLKSLGQNTFILKHQGELEDADDEGGGGAGAGPSQLSRSMQENSRGGHQWKGEDGGGGGEGGEDLPHSTSAMLVRDEQFQKLEVCMPKEPGERAP